MLVIFGEAILSVKLGHHFRPELVPPLSSVPTSLTQLSSKSPVVIFIPQHYTIIGVIILKSTNDLMQFSLARMMLGGIPEHQQITMNEAIEKAPTIYSQLYIRYVHSAIQKSLIHFKGTSWKSYLRGRYDKPYPILRVRGWNFRGTFQKMQSIHSRPSFLF